MNYIFFGKESDINIGNGKTLSAVKVVFSEHFLENRKVFSNIKLNCIPYTPLTPENLYDILEKENHGIILFDELHAIIDKNHRISETCRHHRTMGLCYHLKLFFRQVRKKDFITVSTCQSFYDAHRQLRQLMQILVLCEKYAMTSDGKLEKCFFPKCTQHDRHYIFQTNIKTGNEKIITPDRYFDLYDSNEIVHGWID